MTLHKDGVHLEFVKHTRDGLETPVHRAHGTGVRRLGEPLLLGGSGDLPGML